MNLRDEGRDMNSESEQEKAWEGDVDGRERKVNISRLVF